MGNRPVVKVWTSFLNPRDGAIGLVAIAAYWSLIVSQSWNAQSFLYFAIYSTVQVVLCLLSRWQLTINFASGAIISTSGIWPFVKTRTFRTDQVSCVQISSRNGVYQIILILKDHTEVPASKSMWWRILQKSAQSIAKQGGWESRDISSGVNSIFRFMDKPRRVR